MRTRVLTTMAGVACAIALWPATAAVAAPDFTDGDGLHVVSATKLDDRLTDLKVTTDALSRPVDIDVLLPDGYDANPSRRYPVLYLFHGTSGRAADWTKMGDAERTTAGLPLIVVMPDAGYDGDGGGWFTNWFNGGAGGRPRWETFHIDQVIPFVDRTLRTIPERRGRAIYGLSQGGFGAMTYAARHPDLFLAAGAYSGAVETTADPEAQLLVTPIVQATAFGLDGAAPDAMFGPRLTQQVNWAAHDPGTLAANLRGIDLRFYTGNGDGAGTGGAPVDPIEAGVHELTLLLHRRLDRLGIPSALRDYGPGTHAWKYWAADLRDTVGPLMDEFDHPRPDPSPVAYRSGENGWSAWGYEVTMHRPAREFSTLSGGDARGFSLTGSGSATVVTPAAYRPRSDATVRITGATADVTQTATADDAGRLTLEVPLGPGNPDQQFTAAALLRGTKRFTTRVRIDGVPPVSRVADRRRARHRSRARRSGRPPARRPPRRAG